MGQVLSGCAVRAEIQKDAAAEKERQSDLHYLGAIKQRMELLYSLVDDPRLREQISDEVDWLDEKIEAQSPK